MTLAQQVDLEESAAGRTGADGSREEDHHQQGTGTSPNDEHNQQQLHHQAGQQVYSTLTPRYSMRTDLYTSKDTDIGGSTYDNGIMGFNLG